MFPPGECGFCSTQGHFLRECPVVTEFIRNGKCFRNVDNKIVLPNGQFIPRGTPGRNLMEKIESWNNHNPPPPPPQRAQQPQTFERDQPPHTVAAMSYTTCQQAETLSFGRLSLVAEDMSGDETRVWAQSQTKPKGKPEEIVKKGPPPKSAMKTNQAPAGGPRPTAANPPRPLPPAVSDRTIPPQPAFKYQAPIENPELIQKVIQRTLGSQVTISNEELLAISPDIRRFYKENTVTRRLPTVESGMFEEKEALTLSYSQGRTFNTFLLTASPIDSLRVIDMLVNDTHKITCTLDQGSEIVAMNRNVWQSLGVSLSPEKTLTMESADSNQSVTAGVVENLKFSLGGIDLHLQVHVVDGAPFDILVGRPFFRFTECHTKDYTDGSQELTLTCPNTGNVQTVATRIKPPKSVSFTEPLAETLPFVVNVEDEDYDMVFP